MIESREGKPRWLILNVCLLVLIAWPTRGAEPESNSPSDVPQFAQVIRRDEQPSVPRPNGAIRIATFNVALAGQRDGEMLERLPGGNDPQARAVAEIIQQVDPDILLLNEFDYDPAGKLLAVFATEYLAVPQNGCDQPGSARAVHFPHSFAAPVNTGVASGFDLNRDGMVATEANSGEYASDAWGYGRYPGQYGMVVLSKYPINREQVRAFGNFCWQDMPGALLPQESPEPGQAWYSGEILERFPLSSKSHWDVPVQVGDDVVHVLASHPTPPVFDGPEDRNGRRNHDEIRFWADYIDEARAGYIVDDRGQRGGLEDTAKLVILGDLNSDPVDGTDPRYPIQQLLKHARLNGHFAPRSAGAEEQSKLQAGANLEHRGEAATDTSDFADKNGPGNLRLDYVLPSADLQVVGGGVYWPASSHPRFALVGDGHPVVSSDHRLVWIDVELSRRSSAQKSE